MVLVDLYWTRDKDPRVPLGHASLLAALHAATTTDVRSVVVPVNLGAVDPAALVERILAHTRDVSPAAVDVAIGVYVWAEVLVQQVLAGLRAGGFTGRIILGGPQITYAPPGVAQLYPQADVFVRGHGEAALCELAGDPGRPWIAGVHHAGEPDRGDQTQVELERLPSPWLSRSIPLDGQRFVRWETQRGCTFSCTFCQHREPETRLRPAALSLDRVMQEIDLMCAAHVEDIAVLDPIFNLHAHATSILGRFVANGFRGRLSLQCRAEAVKPAFLDAAARLDVRLEFGLQTIHAREGAAVRRHNNLVKVDATLAEVRRRGIDHEVTLIFGLPEQTLTSFIESVAWCLERRVPVIKAFPLMLLRGTQLERERARWGLVEDGSAMPRVIASHSFSEDDSRAMAAISDALAQTEGRHPERIADLLALAAVLDPDPERWQPRSSMAVAR